MKIRNKMILTFSVIILVTLIFGAYLFQIQFGRFVKKRLEQTMQSSAQITVQQIRHIINDCKIINETMARSDAVANMLLNPANDEKAGLQRFSSQRVCWIGIIDRDGVLHYSSAKRNTAALQETSPFKISFKKTSVIPIHISEFTGDTVFSVSSPVIWENDTLGALVFEYGYKEISAVLQHAHIFGEEDERYLVSRDGRILSTLRPNREQGSTVSVQDSALLNCFFAQKDAANPRMRVYKNYMGKDVFGIGRYLPELDNCLFVELDKNKAWQPILIVRNYLLYGFAMALLLLIITVFFAADHFTRPISRLTIAVRELARGNLEHPIEGAGKDEIGLLTNAFIKMRNKIKDTEKRLKSYNKELFAEVARRTKEIKERMAESEEQRLESDTLRAKLEEVNDELLNEIEERKKVEAALKESEARYKIASDLTSDYAFAYNVAENGKLELLWVSGALQRLTGFSGQEIVERGGWESLIHPDDVSIPLEQLGALLSGKTEVVEYRIIARDGQVRWMRDYGRPYFDEQQKRVTTIYGAIQDITEKKNTEQELGNSEKSYRELFDSSNDAIYIQDRNGVFLAVNKGAEKMYGYPKEYFVGRTPEFISAEGKNDLQMVGKCIEKAFAGEPQLFEFWGKRKNGDIFPKEVRLHKGTYFGKEVIIAMAQDITKRKQAEEQLLKLSQALEQSPVSIVILNSTRLIEYVNDGFCQITGFDPSEVIGEDPLILRAKDHDRQVYDDLWATIEKGGTWQGELLSRRKDGKPFWEEVTAAPLFDDMGNITHYIAFKIDVTEKKAMEEEFRQAMKMEAIGRLAGGVAHDFNNLLTVILGYTELILMKMDADSPFYKKIQEIDKAGRRAEQVTSQLLAFSRKQIMQPKILEVNRLIREMQKMLPRLIGEHIQLELQLDRKDSLIKTDPGQIEQVILNLAINARDAMPEGGKLVIRTGRKKIGREEARQYEDIEPGEYVKIIVKDMGSGMADETVERIFEPFFTTKEKGRGTGLGLSTVYGIIKQSKGHIAVESAPGRGSTFKIYLPLVSGEQASEKEENADVIPSGDEYILVVEDEHSLKELVIETLEKFGYKIIAASNGKEALELCAKENCAPDLILTDVIMPAMGGKQFYEEVKIKYPDTKVIYMSGYTDDDIVKQGVLTPDTEFIQKPFNLMDLVKKVRNVLDDKLS